MLSVHKIGFELPAEKVDVLHLEKLLNLTKAQMQVYTRVYGLSKVSVHYGPLEDMMLSALHNSLHDFVIEPNKIKYLIHCHTAQMVWPFMRSIPTEIASRMGFTKALSF